MRDHRNGDEYIGSHVYTEQQYKQAWQEQKQLSPVKHAHGKGQTTTYEHEDHSTTKVTVMELHD